MSPVKNAALMLSAALLLIAIIVKLNLSTSLDSWYIQKFVLFNGDKKLSQPLHFLQNATNDLLKISQIPAEHNLSNNVTSSILVIGSEFQNLHNHSVAGKFEQLMHHSDHFLVLYSVVKNESIFYYLNQYSTLSKILIRAIALPGSLPFTKFDYINETILYSRKYDKCIFRLFDLQTHFTLPGPATCKYQY